MNDISESNSTTIVGVRYVKWMLLSTVLLSLCVVPFTGSIAALVATPAIGGALTIVSLMLPRKTITFGQYLRDGQLGRSGANVISKAQVSKVRHFPVYAQG